VEKSQEEVSILMEELIRTTLDAQRNTARSKLDNFKGVTKKIVASALKTLDEIQMLWEIDRGSMELREQLHLLQHYLDYLKRFCERKV
jgi:hypothetical protein